MKDDIFSEGCFDGKGYPHVEAGEKRAEEGDCVHAGSCRFFSKWACTRKESRTCGQATVLSGKVEEKCSAHDTCKLFTEKCTKSISAKCGAFLAVSSGA